VTVTTSTNIFQHLTCCLF